MTLAVIWLQSARDDMAGLLRFIAEDNPYAATEWKRQMEAAAQSLADFPYRARAGRIAGTRELLAHPNYWIAYRVTLAAVEILAVLHTRREYP